MIFPQTRRFCLRDLVPPDAETEASAVEALMKVFAAHGYQRVKPGLGE